MQDKKFILKEKKAKQNKTERNRAKNKTNQSKEN